MALIVNSSGNYVNRTANLPTINAFTIGGWFYRTTDRNAAESFIELADGAGGHYNDIQVEATNNLTFSSSKTTTVGHDWVAEPATGVWLYVAMTGDGTNLKAYWYSAAFALVESVQSDTYNGTPHTPDEIGFLGNVAYNNWCDAKCAYGRVWNAALTQAEIEAELRSSVIIRTANINTAFGKDSGTDVSGNGRNWTLSAGVTTDSTEPSGLTGITYNLMGQAVF